MFYKCPLDTFNSPKNDKINVFAFKLFLTLNNFISAILSSLTLRLETFCNRYLVLSNMLLVSNEKSP